MRALGLAAQCWIGRLWRRWWYGKPGRHDRRGTWLDLSTGQMDAIEADLATRPLYAAPALKMPAPGPELSPAEDWEPEARLRLLSPHCFAPAEDYWRWAWQWFWDGHNDFLEKDEFLADKNRAECGLGPRHSMIPIAA